MPKGNLWTLAVVAVLLALLLPAANIAYADSTHERSTSEDINVTYDEIIHVDKDAYEYGEEHTLKDNNGNTLTEGVDYEWYPSNGSLKYYDTSATTENDTDTLNYTYYIHDQPTADASFILDIFGDWGGILIMIAAIGALLGLLFRGSGSSGGGSF